MKIDAATSKNGVVEFNKSNMIWNDLLVLMHFMLISCSDFIAKYNKTEGQQVLQICNLLVTFKIPP